MIKGFKPIVGENAKLLILGSMPSITSLSKNEYYGFKYNRFWKIMFYFFNEEYSDVYEDKIQLLKKHHIALWDVISHCEREGSLDSKIKDEICNDIESIIEQYPTIQAVLCNGKKSYDLYIRHFSNIELPCFYLPSTSNANRSIKENELFDKWCNILSEYIKR